MNIPEEDGKAEIIILDSTVRFWNTFDLNHCLGKSQMWFSQQRLSLKVATAVGWRGPESLKEQSCSPCARE